MIAGIPSFHDYVRDKNGKALGRCGTCAYEGPVDSSMTGYECPKCKGMKIEFTVKDGHEYRQFVHNEVH
jgi:hypothetical protein